MSKQQTYEMYCKAAPNIARAIEENHEQHGIACAFFVNYPDKYLHSEVEA